MLPSVPDPGTFLPVFLAAQPKCNEPASFLPTPRGRWPRGFFHLKAFVWREFSARASNARFRAAAWVYRRQEGRSAQEATAGMETATLTVSPGLDVELRDGVVHLTLSRPEKRNALARELLAELETALTQIAADTAARVVVLGASGPVFCSRHDLNQMVGCSEAAYHELFDLCSRVMRHFRRLPQPRSAR